MTKGFCIIASAALLTLLLASIAPGPDTTGIDQSETMAQIDGVAAAIDSNLALFKHKHHKTMDCFGWDIYYDTSGIVKFYNYQSCFRLDYYYQAKKLILCTIDGSFQRTCGYTQANYCWNTEIPRNFKSRMYFRNGKLVKEVDEGARPCCPISPGGYVGDSIEFVHKAKLILKEYGKTKELESLIY